MNNAEATIPILKERRNKSRKEIKTSTHVVEKAVSFVQVHCHVDSFTIKCHLFVAEAAAVGFFSNAQLLDQDHNCNSFVQSCERATVKAQSKDIQSIKGPVIFLSGKIYSETRLNIQLNLNF